MRITKNVAKKILRLKLEYLLTGGRLNVGILKKLGFTVEEIINFYSPNYLGSRSYVSKKRGNEFHYLFLKNGIQYYDKKLLKVTDKYMDLKRYMQDEKLKQLSDAIEYACQNNFTLMRLLLVKYDDAIIKKIAFEVLKAKDIDYLRNNMTILLVDDILHSRAKKLYNYLKKKEMTNEKTN